LPRFSKYPINTGLGWMGWRGVESFDLTHNPKVSWFKSRPRNQLKRHVKVASLWRPLRLLGSSQHRGQIPLQLNSELSLNAVARALVAFARRRLRSQDDRINQPSEHLRGFQPRVLALEGGGEFLDLRAVEVGHARVQERRWFVGGLELGFELEPPVFESLHLRLALLNRNNPASCRAASSVAPRSAPAHASRN